MMKAQRLAINRRAFIFFHPSDFKLISTPASHSYCN
jgi:hypothetical protein